MTKTEFKNFNLYFMVALSCLIFGIVDLVTSLIATDCIKTSPEYNSKSPRSIDFAGFSMGTGIFMTVIGVLCCSSAISAAQASGIPSPS